MTGLGVTDATGTYKPAQGLFIADSTGTYKAARNAWIAKSNGQYTQVWPTNTSIVALSVVKGASGTGKSSWRNATLSWSTRNSTKVELRLVGTTPILYTGTGTTFIYTGTPGQTYKFFIRAYGIGGAFVDSSPVQVKLDALPAPANFKRTGGTSFGAFYGWDGVDGADGYEVVDTLAAGNPLQGSTNADTFALAETDLKPLTTYERAVRSKLGSTRSALSGKYRFTTGAAPASPAGFYLFPAQNIDVWAPRAGAWRGSSVGAVHGNGDNWGGVWGDQYTFFFYDYAAMRALSGRVTGFGVRIKRDSAAGYSAPQLSHWWMHTYQTRPGGAPQVYNNANQDGQAMAWGADILQPLPPVWGQALIDDDFNAAGLVWGGVPGRYMRGLGLAGFAQQGEIYIIIG